MNKRLLPLLLVLTIAFSPTFAFADNYKNKSGKAPSTETVKGFEKNNKQSKEWKNLKNELKAEKDYIESLKDELELTKDDLEDKYEAAKESGDLEVEWEQDTETIIISEN
ncbi:MAG: hypothetical protein PHX63_06560 [Eubacteriales bacterium]|nr:hypothetical protein [Eubacteriales bacterium]